MFQPSSSPSKKLRNAPGRSGNSKIWTSVQLLCGAAEIRTETEDALIINILPSTNHVSGMAFRKLIIADV
jgi:hypothetical protein